MKYCVISHQNVMLLKNNIDKEGYKVIFPYIYIKQTFKNWWGKSIVSNDIFPSDRLYEGKYIVEYDSVRGKETF